MRDRTSTYVGPPPARGAGWSWQVAFLAVPVICVALVPLIGAIPEIPLLVLVFVLASVGVLLLAPRGLAVSRTWVIGYLVLQFPIRSLFLLSTPLESPPLYAETSPGLGLEAALRQALLQSMLGLAALLVFYVIAKPRTTSPLITTAELRYARLYGLLAVSALLLPLEAASTSSSAAGGGFVLSLPGLFASGASAVVCYAFVQAPRKYLVTFLLVIAYTLTRVVLLHSKLAVLACAVAVVVGLTAREHVRLPGRSVTGRGLALLIVATMSALYVFALSSGRNHGQDLAGSLNQGGSAVISRSYGVDALIASNRYVAGGGQHVNGETFIELAYSWIPRQLWPDKPKSFSIRFGEDVFSFSHSVGNEFFAPSYSGEWVLNFGLFGLLVGWSLFGVAMARVDAMPSLAHRMLWLVSLVHLVEGSIVAQAWLAAPFVLGGYWALGRPAKPQPAPA